jgi:hypothetical protein
MGAFRLMCLTYQFLILRLVVNLAAIIPGFYAIRWGVSFFRKLTGLEGLLIADIMFGYIGLVVFIIYIELARKFLGHLIKYAQVASATELLNSGDVKAASLSFGFKEMLKRFGSVSAMSLADAVMRAAFTKASEWVVDKATFVPEIFKKGMLVTLFKTVVKTVLFHVDEIVVSHMYRNPDLSAWEGIVEGVQLYFKSWKTVLKSAFFSTLWLKLFSWVLHSVIVISAIVMLWSSGAKTLLVFLITYKIVTVLLKSTLLEPYLTMSMLVGFYNTEHGELGDNSIKDRLLEVVGGAKSMLFSGKRNDSEVVESLTSLITDSMKDTDDTEEIMSDASDILNRMMTGQEEST